MPFYSLYLPGVKVRQTLILTTQYHYLRNVLRIKEGSQILVLDGIGREFSAKVIKIDAMKRKIRIRIGDIAREEERKKPVLNIFCSIPKGTKFDFVVQKTTELGADSLIPIITQYQERKPQGENFIERAKRISQEAMEQSRRLYLPHIGEIMDFKKAVDTASDFSRVLVFDAREGIPLRNILDQIKESENISVFIGPQAGFSSQELDYAEEKSCSIVKLEKFPILRTETAAIFISGLLFFHLKR